jgi:hypothetical protein
VLLSFSQPSPLFCMTVKTGRFNMNVGVVDGTFTQNKSYIVLQKETDTFRCERGMRRGERREVSTFSKLNRDAYSGCVARQVHLPLDTSWHSIVPASFTRLCL